MDGWFITYFSGSITPDSSEPKQIMIRDFFTDSLILNLSPAIVERKIGIIYILIGHWGRWIYETLNFELIELRVFIIIIDGIITKMGTFFFSCS